jgi:hypothetical protein
MRVDDKISAIPLEFSTRAFTPAARATRPSIFHGFHLSSGISLPIYLLLQATSMDLIFVKFAYLLSTYVLATSFPPGHEELFNLRVCCLLQFAHGSMMIDADKYKHSI